MVSEPTGATPLQTWTVTLFDVLADALDELDEFEYAVLVDIGWRRLTSEAVRIGLDECRRAA